MATHDPAHSAEPAEPADPVNAAELPELPELAELQQLVREGGEHLQCRTLCEVATGGRVFPVQAVTLGNADPRLPGVGLFGGVHGLERIGAEVVLACLRSLVRRLRWDATLHHLLQHLRIVFVPVVNPVGCGAARAPTRRAWT